MDTLIKISGGFDFTPFLVDGGDGYAPLENQRIETKRTPQSSGYDKRTLAKNKMTTIKLRFRAGISSDDTRDILEALDADTAIFEYWSKRYKVMRQAIFEIACGEIGTLSIPDDFINDEWGVELKTQGTPSNVVPTVITRYAGTVTDKSGTWNGEDNIKTDAATYATCPGAKGENHQLIASNFGFNIPANAKIDSVTKEVCYHVSTQGSSFEFYMAAAYKGSYRGGSIVKRDEPLADDIWSSSECGTWTIADLNSANAQIYVGYKRTSDVACLMSVKWVRMIVSYTEVN